MWEYDHKGGWALKNWCFWLVVLKTFGSPLGTRKSNQSILKEINPQYSLKELMLKLRHQIFGHLMRKANFLDKTLRLKDWVQEKGVTKDEMVEWHHWLKGCEFLSKLAEIVKDREAWHAAVIGVTKSQTWLSTWATARFYLKPCLMNVDMTFLPW